jgi:ribonuclease P/MRP protein subunit RPP40
VYSNVQGPIAQHHPQIREVKPQVTQMSDVVVPMNRSKKALSDPLYEEQLLEWIGMASMDSPRVQPNSIDSYLCRYDLPEDFDAEDTTFHNPQSLVHLRWHGLASSNFVLRTWLIPKAALGEHWFALSAADFGETSYTILCAGGRDVMIWECA